MELDELEEVLRQLETVHDQLNDWATDEILEHMDALMESLEDAVGRERARLAGDPDADD